MSLLIVVVVTVYWGFGEEWGARRGTGESWNMRSLLPRVARKPTRTQPKTPAALGRDAHISHCLRVYKAVVDQGGEISSREGVTTNGPESSSSAARARLMYPEKPLAFSLVLHYPPGTKALVPFIFHRGCSGTTDRGGRSLKTLPVHVYLEPAKGKSGAEVDRPRFVLFPPHRNLQSFICAQG
jgi:hypothetical protein